MDRSQCIAPSAIDVVSNQYGWSKYIDNQYVVGSDVYAVKNILV